MSEEIIKSTQNKIAEVKQAFGAPGDWGYDDPKGQALYGLYNFGATLAAHAPAAAADTRDAVRYRWLRSRDVGTIYDGGVFVGKTPGNLVLSGIHLDAAVDAARIAEQSPDAGE
ncbi:hypothetical protein HNR60_001513 [Rhodopseudomonas rhenobacensis]|uniref:Uncharacterized protein n=1 Tax=Rhodopseudomonas rhenobacensis TaxID=87461 RepID=A0A7W7Z2C9_9BRAD|nr:hypothetical protein [Rhodopseudomonas rhenobacensis]MBB5046765.1 hypothetical protein [Rhodopseudomonas rhenobacensis]